MNQVTPPSGVKGSAPVSPAPKSNVAVEPGEQFYERALRWPLTASSRMMFTSAWATFVR